MNLLERIKQMIKGESGEAEQVIKDSHSTREMMEHLDELITRNEVELRKTRQELARLELNENASAENIRQGRVGDREKEFVLLQIKRTRGQMENLKLRADILNKNIELHLNLVGKIQAMEAMDLRGIEQGVVEKVMLDFEEGMEKFRESVQSGDGVIKSRNEVLTTKDKDDLRKLESEILGERKPAEKKNADMDAELAALEEELKGRESKPAEKEQPKGEKPQVE